MDQLFRKKGISKLTMAYGLMFILFLVQPFQNLWWIFTYGVKETHIGFSDHFYTALEQFYESWSYIVTYTVIGVYRLIEVICLSLLVVLSSKVTRTKKACLILNGILAVINCVVWVGTFAGLLKLTDDDVLYHLPSLDNIIFSIMLITTYFFILMPTESAFDEKKDLKLLDEVMEEVMREQNQSDIQELLTTYEGLMHRGIISVEEFEQRKNRLLG